MGFTYSNSNGSLCSVGSSSTHERRARLDAIKAYVSAHDIGAWIDSQLADLDAVERGAGTRLPV